jgi:hypothetical protein
MDQTLQLIMEQSKELKINNSTGQDKMENSDVPSKISKCLPGRTKK